MRSLVLRAGTVAGVVAVLALPTSVAQAAPTTTSATVSSSATTGRIVSGEALAAAVAATESPSTSTPGPVVQRRPLGAGTTETGYAEVAS